MNEQGNEGAEDPVLEHVQHVIPDIGIVVVKTEVVRDDSLGEDRWVRYTVRDEDGREHCVGTRLESLVRDADFVALDRHRRKQHSADRVDSPVSDRDLRSLEQKNQGFAR